MSSIDVPLRKVGSRQPAFGQTMRTDAWWKEPLLVFLGFATFIVYSTWAGTQNAYYEVPGTGYLSPMYSPLLMRTAPSWWPAFFPFSAAMLILWAPGGFRLTCYYYRGAYYKAFWADPPSCSVGEPRKGYRGEQKFPLIVQNIHRYFLYLALIFIAILLHDAWKAMWFDGKFGIGIGTIVLTLNPIFLASYTLGCHSLRHLIGGRKDAISKSSVQKTCYDCVSSLNSRHMLFAWISLFWVGFSDLYVRMVSMGIWTDWRLV